MLAIGAVDFAYKLNARGEQALGERLCSDAFGYVGVLVEKLEIPAPVEDVEELFVPARSEQVGTEARPTANHLPELGLRPQTCAVADSCAAANEVHGLQ